MRPCSRCRILLPLECFNRLGSGRQYYCRRCFSAYYLERRTVLRRQVDAALGRRIARASNHVLAILRRTECADCCESDVIVLEFDHVGVKRAHISALVSAGASIARLNEEIAECDIVCLNCHRRRTGSRAGWARADPEWRQVLERLEPRGRRRNVTFAYAHLEQHGCVDCGVHDLVVLDFDHVGAKRFAVMRGAWDGVALTSLRREMSECQVRCGNCHRRQTASRARQRRWRLVHGHPQKTERVFAPSTASVSPVM